MSTVILSYSHSYCPFVPWVSRRIDGFLVATVKPRPSSNGSFIFAPIRSSSTRVRSWNELSAGAKRTIRRNSSRTIANWWTLLLEFPPGELLAVHTRIVIAPNTYWVSFHNIDFHVYGRVNANVSIDFHYFSRGISEKELHFSTCNSFPKDVLISKLLHVESDKGAGGFVHIYNNTNQVTRISRFSSITKSAFKVHANIPPVMIGMFCFGLKREPTKCRKIAQ